MKRGTRPLILLLLVASACGGRAQSAPAPASTPQQAPAPANTPPPAQSSPNAEPGTWTDPMASPADGAGAVLPDTAGLFAPVPLPWRPPDTGPSREAQLVLDTLPEPAAIGLPSGLPRGAVTSSKPAAPRTSDHVCYEVQLLGTSNEAAARETARRAEASLGVPAYAVWENSLFKVRAGGCLTRAEAEALRARARSGDYPEAFLTETAPK